MDKKLPEHNTRKEILSKKGAEKYKETVGRPSKESLSTIDNDLPKHNTHKKNEEPLSTIDKPSHNTRKEILSKGRYN